MIDYGLAPDAGLLILRLVVGLSLAAHGWAKFTGKGGIAGVGQWFESIGVRPGRGNAAVAASIELTAGLGLAFGVLTPLPAAGVVAVMLVASWTAHRHNGYFTSKGGWELDLIIAAGAVAVAATGAGRFSVDHLLFADLGIAQLLGGWWGLLIALGLGLAGGIGQLALFYRDPKKHPQQPA